MEIKQLPIKTPQFGEQYLEDIVDLTIGKVVPQLKGSYTRKDDGDYITDIDNNSYLTFTDETHTEVYNMLTSLTRPGADSKFIFIYLGCGWINEYIPPWEIDPNGGCVFELERALAWLAMLEEKKMLPDTALGKIQQILADSDTMVIRNLITIRGIVKEYGELKWRVADIEKGYIDYNPPPEIDLPPARYDFLAMLKTHNGILEFIYNPKRDTYVSVTTSLADKSFPIDQFKAFWPFYTQNYYSIVKALRWRLHKDKQDSIFKRTMTVTSPYVSLMYQIENLKNMLRYHPDMARDIGSMWSRTIRPVMRELRIKEYNGSEVPSTQVLSHLDGAIKDYVDNLVLSNYPERLFLTFIKVPEERKKLEIKLLRMRDSQRPVTKAALVARWNAGNMCPFFLVTIADLNMLADLAQRTYIGLEQLTRCFVDLSITDGRSVTELIGDVFEQNHLSINVPRGKQEVKLFHQKNLIATFPTSDKKRIQRFIITYRPSSVK
jgi:hypothetical protein